MAPLKALLALEDGSKYFGVGFGKPIERYGEVVFNTGMVGYTESLTDASYAGQILIQTYPLIGNYGVPSKQTLDRFGLLKGLESLKIQVSGYVIQQLSNAPSHRNSSKTLDEWLMKENVGGIWGIDTRQLTKKIRMKGVMLGILKVAKEIELDELDDKAKHIPDPTREDLVGKVTIQEPVVHMNGSNKIILIDCGVKFGIVRNLLSRGVTVIRVPAEYPVDKMLAYEPNGIVLSNGPGEPKNCVKTIKNVSELLECNIPMMGICLGNEFLGLAAGGDTYKLKFGHRGQNHPCRDLTTGRIYITSQNHGFTLKTESLEGTPFKPYFLNANDGTLEGIIHKSKPIFGIQFHPEGSPGPEDTGFLFDKFLAEVEKCHATCS